MLPSEIETLCAETSAITGIPVEDVLHHVHEKAGKPCSPCGGSGIMAQKACPMCGGTGGKASYVRVTNALAWIKNNVTKLLAYSEKKRQLAVQEAAEKRHIQIVTSEGWKKDHPDLWDFLEGMQPGEFKASIMKAILEGDVSIEQETALHNMLQHKKRKEALTPIVGERVRIQSVIISAVHSFDLRGIRVFRVEFESEAGWRGRIDVSQSETVDKIQARQTDKVSLDGMVVWRREGYAILSGNTIVLL